MNGVTIIEEHLCRVVEMPSLIGIGIVMSLLIIGVLAFIDGCIKIVPKIRKQKS